MKKKIIITGLLFLALLVAGEVYVRSDGFSEKIRSLTGGPLQEILGSDASIGRIRTNLIPLFIEARDISIPDPEGRQAIAIRKIRVYINPLPLLLKKIRLPSITILEPRIFAERSADRRLNLIPVIDRIRSNLGRKTMGGGSGYRVLLRNITVSQGRIELKDAVTAGQLSVSAIQAAGRVNLRGDSVVISVRNAEVRAQAPALPPLAGDFKASGRFEQGQVQLESLELTTADAVVALSGSTGPLLEPVLDLKFRARSGPRTISKFTQLFKQVKKEQRSSLQAEATVKGRPSSPSIEGQFKLSGISYRGMVLKDASLAFQYNDKQGVISGQKWKIVRAGKSIFVDEIAASFGSSSGGFDVQHLAVRAGDLTVFVAGRADPQAGFDSIISAESGEKGETLSFLTTLPVKGSITVKGGLSGALNKPVFEGEFSGTNMIVRGIAFERAAGRLQYRSKKLTLSSVDINQQSSRFLFNGSIDLNRKEPVFGARLAVVDADIAGIVALFYKPIPLKFPGTGELSFAGTARDFTGTGQLSVGPGSAYGETFRKGTITASLTRSRITFPQVQVDKGHGTVTASGWIGFDRTYAAVLQSHDVRLSEVDLLKALPMDGAFDLSIESSGPFSRPRLSSSLRVAECLLNGVPVGGMAAEVNIADKLLSGKARLSGDRIILTGELGLTGPFAWTLDTAFSGRDLDPLLLSGRKELAGRIRADMAGSMTVRGMGRDPASRSGTLAFRRLGIRIGDYQLESESPAMVALRTDRLMISSLNLKGRDTRISVTGGARLFRDIDLLVSGTGNLSLLRPLIQHLEHSDGTAEVKLGIRDAWSSPDVEGELIVRDGEVKIRELPQKFSHLAAKILFDRSRIILDSLTGQTGGGTLSATGRGQVEGFGLRDFSTTVSFDNISVRYPEGLSAVLSGNLYFDAAHSEQSLTGDVQIKRARYEKRIEWKSMLVDIGKGLYQRKKAEAGRAADTQINIRFFGKENILFQNNLAKMPLEVDVFLHGTIHHPQLIGRIEARKGSVYFRQNEFRIIHGAADFVDPNRINPVLDIQAETQVREYLVRLAVSGTAERAIVTLLSDPSLPDSDILALLALGKTGTELKGREAGVGMSEAAAFATGRFQDLFESRARSLTGLDRFQVDPYVSKGDTSVPRVTVGKEIVQGKLYVTYSSNIGATMPEQIFRIEYILNKHFSVVGERNELGNTGADLKYRFEFK